jgi:hypothetical protein
MGRSEQAHGQAASISQVDAAYIAALNRIADAIILLAQATAGEFEDNQEDDGNYAVDIAGRRIS